MDKKRVAVLVGCNYPNTENELRGCINDVISMKKILIERFEFKEEDIKVLTDEPGSSVMPTGANIKKALADMIEGANEGDVLYFHYSGHGTLIPSLKPNQPHRKDEAIVPCDFNLITDLDFRELVNRLPPKATFTFLSDSCHSGGLIDQEKEQIGPSTKRDNHHHHHHHIIHSSRPKYIPIESIISKLKLQTNLDTPNIGPYLFEKFKEEASLTFRHHHGLSHGHESHDQGNAMTNKSTDQGILLSGCQTNETSADIEDEDGKNAHGAFTYAVEQTLNENPGPVSYKELVTMTRNVLHKEGMRQHPCLYCSDDNANAPFLLQN